MDSIVPPQRPQAGLDVIQRLASRAMGRELPACYVVGVRGYYRDTMGEPGANDRGIYDDALFVVGPDLFGGFNGNTDPSRQRPGIATLVSGVHWYRPGYHGISRPGGGYPAFRPATPDEALPVTRDGQRGVSDGIAINLHRGGVNGTSSEGCQTVCPQQWDAFHGLLTRALQRAAQTKFPYILIEGPIS